MIELFSDRSGTLLDICCGEGYYTRHMALGRESYGFDISRNAIRLAAKRDPNTLYAVAGSYDIPFEAGAVQFLSTIFSPIAEGEFRRVLRDGGYWMLVVPTERHLYGLKEMLYDQPYENTYQETRYEGFTQVDRRRVEGNIILEDPAMIQALFTMTPYYWKSSKESSERANSATRLETEIGFDFILYQKDKT
ncbi:MAG: methyltransferase domain-containing protein [Clostridia bacterium]|nr:methyltransferase domain-containing protein [Clostridia bacterium]